MQEIERLQKFNDFVIGSCRNSLNAAQNVCTTKKCGLENENKKIHITSIWLKKKYKTTLDLYQFTV